MPHADHRVILRAGALAAALAASVLGAAPAGAEGARSELAVDATILPACLVSTSSRSALSPDIAGAAAVSCTSGTRWSVSVDRPGAEVPWSPGGTDPLPRSARELRLLRAAAKPAQPLTVITVSY